MGRGTASEHIFILLQRLGRLQNCLEPPQVVAPASGETAAAPGFAVEIGGGSCGAQAQVMVPLRAVAEKLGFTVAWDNGAVTVTGAER